MLKLITLLFLSSLLLSSCGPKKPHSKRISASFDAGNPEILNLEGKKCVMSGHNGPLLKKQGDYDPYTGKKVGEDEEYVYIQYYYENCAVFLIRRLDHREMKIWAVPRR